MRWLLTVLGGFLRACAKTVIALLLVGVIIFIFFDSACFWDKSGYTTFEGEITRISYDQYSNIYAFDLAEVPREYQDNTFCIWGKSYDIIIDNGIREKLEVGDIVTVTAHPAYKGNGYMFPVVYLETDGEVLLEFEDGYRNWLIRAHTTL